MRCSQRHIFTIQVLRDCFEPTVTTTARYANVQNCYEGVADALPSPEAGMLSRPSTEACPPLPVLLPFPLVHIHHRVPRTLGTYMI